MIYEFSSYRLYNKPTLNLHLNITIIFIGADNREALSKAALAVAENINMEKLTMSMAHNEGAGEQTFLPCNRNADCLDVSYIY